MVTAASKTPKIITNKNFRKLISERAMELLYMAQFLSNQESEKIILTRPLLGRLMSHAGQIEELLDAYGAKNNNDWCVSVLS